MKHLAVPALCILLAACAHTPVAQPPAQLFSDQLFAAPSERIRADDVFALSDEMKRYLETEMAGRLLNKGLQKGLIDALYSQNQLRLDYDAAITRNAAQAFEARSGNCLSLVIMTAAFAKALGLSVEYHSAFVEPSWSRVGGMYFLSGHVNLTLGGKWIGARAAYATGELLTLERQGRLAESGVLYRKLAQIEPYPAFHFFERGLAAMRLGDFSTARDLFAKEVDRDPYYHEFQFWLGVANLKLGNLGEARKHLGLAAENSSTRGERDLYAAKLEHIRSQSSQ